MALPVLLSVGAGWVGYYAGAMREPVISTLPARGQVGLDYFLTVKSFSEVEQARAVLEALAARYVQQAQDLIAQEIMDRGGVTAATATGGERPIRAAIRLLEEGLVEFEGTGPQMRLLPTLLYALKREGLHDRWLELYLRLLYEHPTHELVAELAPEAVSLSRAVGREQELAAGFQHVCGVPFDDRVKSPPSPSLVPVGFDAAAAVGRYEPRASVPRS